MFQPDAQKRADAAAEQALQDAYDSAEQKLEQLTQDHNGQSGDSRPYSGDLRSRSYARGDVLTIQAGAGVLLIAGDVSVTHDGALVDVTDGKEVPTGSHLAAGHRYLAAEDTTAKLTVRSGLAKVGLQGRYEQKLGGQSAAPFTDVSDGDAWAQAVDHVYRNGLLTGTGDDRFSPGLSMSRAMMMTVFYRLAGSPEGQMAQAEAQFDDVKDGAWFAPYVRWAASQGIDLRHQRDAAPLLSGHAGHPAAGGGDAVRLRLQRPRAEADGAGRPVTVLRRGPGGGSGPRRRWPGLWRTVS